MVPLRISEHHKRRIKKGMASQHFNGNLEYFSLDKIGGTIDWTPCPCLQPCLYNHRKPMSGWGKEAIEANGLSLHAWFVFGAVSCVTSVNIMDADKDVRGAVNRNCSVVPPQIWQDSCWCKTPDNRILQFTDRTLPCLEPYITLSHSILLFNRNQIYNWRIVMGNLEVFFNSIVLETPLDLCVRDLIHSMLCP